VSLTWFYLSLIRIIFVDKYWSLDFKKSASILSLQIMLHMRNIHVFKIAIFKLNVKGYLLFILLSE